MKIDRYQLILNHRLDGQWEWVAFLFLGPGIMADAAIKSVAPFYLTETKCRREANKLLRELGIMNKNQKRRIAKERS